VGKEAVVNKLVWAVVVAVGIAEAAVGDIINVGPGGSIQAAIDGAQDGDEIVVAAGVYVGNLHIDAKDITLRSSAGPDVTIIQPTGEANPLVRVETAYVVINGFTFTDAGTVGQTDLLRIHPTASATVMNCVFRDSEHRGITANGAFISVTGCVFENLTNSEGAAIKLTSPESNVADCVFSNNSATGSGGAIVLGGNATVIDCVFANNSAGAKGGAIRDSLNVAGSPVVMNCIFRNNHADVAGGAWATSVSNPVFINCTFTGNTGGLGGAMYNSGFSFPVVSNTILWDNFPYQIYDSDSLTTVIFSDVEGGWEEPGSLGVIDADPMFADPANGDYHLQTGSPCIDAGHNWAVVELADTDLDGNPRFAADEADFDPGCGIPAVVDMGAYEYQGQPFPVKLGDIDGNGVVNVTDFLLMLGAWGGCVEDCCLADLDLNGNVGITDFLMLLANWG
jgi:predicted outer membrane repeat protein